MLCDFIFPKTWSIAYFTCFQEDKSVSFHLQYIFLNNEEPDPAS